MKIRCMKAQAIVNISKHQLTTSEKSVINKGLDFATIVKWISYLDLLAPIEKTALKIPKARVDEPRWKVRKASKIKHLKERVALKSLLDDKNIILPEDKGNTTVVMDRV